MRLSAVLTAAALLLIPFLPGGAAQAADEWIYTQTDGTGDVYPHAALTFYDITTLKAKMGAAGELIWELKVVDMDKVTGNPRYCINFKVDDVVYQTGVRFDAVAGTQTGQVTAFSRCNWNGQGTAVGTPVLSITGDSVTVTILPTDIPELADGSGLITAISAKVGYSAPQAGGDDEFHDVLTPSVEPKEFTFGAGGGALENLTVAVSESEEVEAGSDAGFTVTVNNVGADTADFNLSVEGLPAAFKAAFSSESANATAGNSTKVNLTLSVPADAAPGEYIFAVWARGSLGRQRLQERDAHRNRPLLEWRRPRRRRGFRNGRGHQRDRQRFGQGRWWRRRAWPSNRIRRRGAHGGRDRPAPPQLGSFPPNFRGSTRKVRKMSTFARQDVAQHRLCDITRAFSQENG